MARKQHEKVTVIGSYSSKNTLFYSLNDNTNVTYNQQYEVELYPPENTIAYTDLIRVRWGSFGSGLYRKRIACIANQRKMGITIGYGYDDKILDYNYGEWNTTEVENLPSLKESQYSAQKGVVFTPDDPIVIQFHNLSQTQDNGALKEVYIRYQFERVVQQ